MTKLEDVVIASAARTPIGRFLGGLSTVPAPQLGAVAIRAALERASVDPARADGVIMGNVVSAGLGQAPARQAALRAGLPETVPCLTINKVCGSGLMAVILASHAIRCGDGEVFVVGGMESMSLAPHLLPRSRTGQRMGDARLVDAMIHDGLWCAFEDHHMGNSAEATARKYGLSREALDACALESHRRAVAAIASGGFRDEIVPVEVSTSRGKSVVDTDECPRADTSAEALARLRPVFDDDGCVTAGNSSALADGAAALVVASRGAAERLGLRPLAHLRGYANRAVEPLWIFEAPAVTMDRLLAVTGLRWEEVHLIELNEAFAAQMLADAKLLGLAHEQVNVKGGAIALGHPIGCSGARILTTLLYALRQRGLHTGIASACLGGGEAVALAVEAE